MSSDYDFYFAQLDAQAGKGKPPETTPGTPHAGFYRNRRYVRDDSAPESDRGPKKRKLIHEPIAFWKDNGVMFCARKIGRAPEQLDEIDELFSQCCRDAVTEEAYRTVMEGGSWPDEVAERAPAERIGPTETQEAMYGQGKPADDAPENERATVGDNSGEVDPSLIMKERIDDVLAQFADWLKGLDEGKIKTQEQADKAANYAALLAELEKEADNTHTIEKQPWLDGGRVVDGRWKPLIAKAEEAKKRIKNNYVAPFLAAEKARVEAEARAERDRLAAEHAMQVAAAAEKGEEAPLPPPKVEVAKVGAGSRGGRVTSLRVSKVGEIEDLSKVAAYLCTLAPPPADFAELCRKLAEKMMKAGVTVPGAKLTDTNTAA